MADAGTTLYQEQVTYTVQIAGKEDTDEDRQSDDAESAKFSNDNDAGSEDETPQPQPPEGSENEDAGAAVPQPVEKGTSQSRKLGKAKMSQAQQTDSSVSVYKRKELMDQAQQTDAAGSEKTSRTILGQISWQSIQQSLRQLSQHSQKSSRGSREQVPGGNGAYAEEGVIWISPRTSREMTNKSQQTSLIWTRKALSELLKVRAQKSQSSTASAKGGENEAEDRISLASAESGVQVEQPVGQESRRSSQKPVKVSSFLGSQHPSVEEFQRSSQEAIDHVLEEAQRSRRSSIVVIEKAQQTYSIVSLDGGTWINRRTGKVMTSNGQQTSDTWIQKFTVTSQPSSVLQSRRSSGASRGGKVEPQGPSVQGSDEAVADVEQLQGAESRRSSRQQLGRESQHSTDIEQTAETEVQKPAGPESMEPQQKPSKVRVEKAQQTYSIVSLEGGSWINRRTGKVMTSHSQQTSATWIQKVTGTAQKPQSRRSSDVAKGGITQAPEARSPKSEEADADLQQPVGQESWHSVEAEKAKDTEAQRLESEESEETLQSRTSYVDVTDEAQQTYSIVSLEEGIWINRKTGKILTTHSQQTSHTSIRTLSATSQKTLEQVSWRSSGFGEEGMLETPEPTGAEGDGTDMDVPQLLGQDSRRSSQQRMEQESRRSSGVASAERRESQEPAGLVSEQTLLSRSSSTGLPKEAPPIYSVVSQEEGTWLNQKTGVLVKSKSQQTNESCIQKLKEEQWPTDEDPQSSSYAAGVDLIEIPEPPFCGADERDALGKQPERKESLLDDEAGEMPEATGATSAVSDGPDAEPQPPEEEESP
nr:uncharacterized protein LOC112545400 isoform X1 [Pelodiscus sinensis]XP_025039212.1 uncharacterized protein LOC112545400 isoform X2 [Pelodiscus sinensis]XP_025039213.1 uncharacterized protein LOC112545400 isoform X3 [Pelodiscus sinensis]|eukprot:XP_025039211.1 uncharacterized protein LOC112545400 isoform X1 [Pelodiscus sinensis]